MSYKKFQKGSKKDKIFESVWGKKKTKISERNKTSLRCVVIGLQESSKVPIPSQLFMQAFFYDSVVELLCLLLSDISDLEILANVLST